MDPRVPSIFWNDIFKIFFLSDFSSQSHVGVMAWGWFSGCLTTVLWWLSKTGISSFPIWKWKMLRVFLEHVKYLWSAINTEGVKFCQQEPVVRPEEETDQVHATATLYPEWDVLTRQVRREKRSNLRKERTSGDFFSFLLVSVLDPEKHEIKTRKKQPISTCCGDSKVVVSQLNFAETLDSCCSYLT